MYNPNDIVLIKTRFIKNAPPIHVKLVKKHVVKPHKGNKINWKGYVGWDAVLTKPREASILKKKWQIPFKFPNNIDTFVFEEDIIKKVK